MKLSFKVKNKPVLAELGNPANIDAVDIFHSVYEGSAAYILKRMFLSDQSSKLRKMKLFLGQQQLLLDIDDLVLKVNVSIITIHG